MRSGLFLLMAAGSIFAIGCNSRSEVSDSNGPEPMVAAVTTQPPVDPVNENEIIVFRAKYYRTRGLCIRHPDGSLAMPVVDGFSVVEVVMGDLKAKALEVRPFSGGGSGYPKELVEGKVYTLRLNPAERTRKQLREGESHVRVDEVELQEHAGMK